MGFHCLESLAYAKCPEFFPDNRSDLMLGDKVEHSLEIVW